MASPRHLHIISFDVPLPPVYGGIIDVFYKIKTLTELGIKIHLHCFLYGGKKPQKALEEICTTVNYYKRKPFWTGLKRNEPYIIYSRRSEKLLKNLASDNNPILFEGMHTCYYLSHPVLKEKKQMVRMHNLEWEYYSALAKASGNPVKKRYFQWEAKQLERYAEKLAKADKLMAISPTEKERLQQSFEKTAYIPAFHANEEVISKEGNGYYALYQAKLSIPENEKAAFFIVEIFKNLDFPLVIAGYKPSKSLLKAIKPYKHMELIANPEISRMKYLTLGAQLNLLPTFQSTGIKLKLLNALFQGRWCVANDQMIKGTQLEELCEVANSKDEFERAVRRLSSKLFSNEEIRKRRKILSANFSNQDNAEKLIRLIYE